MRTGRDHVLLGILLSIPIVVVSLIVAIARIRNLLSG
jgi:hypothetical protein